MPQPSSRPRRPPPPSCKSCATCTPVPQVGYSRLAHYMPISGIPEVGPRPRRSGVRRSVMPEAFICDGMRTPIGRYGGSLAKVRTDDLAAVPIKALMAKHPKLDWSAVDEVYLGCANQAGEDNRNVAQMALLLAGLPETVPGAPLTTLSNSG